MATGTKTILIVEDVPDTRESLALLFRQEGYDVATAADGKDAFDYLREHPRPDVILLDLMLPVMDGWQFLQAQLQNPDLADIPVVVHTGAGAGANDPRLKGVQGFCAKPSDSADLLAAIKRCAGEPEHKQGSGLRCQKLGD